MTAKPFQFNQVYELRDTEEQRQQRAAMLRVVYASADPAGWDARRLGMEPRTLRDLFHALQEEHARQQAADHSRAGLAGDVLDGAATHDEERVAAGLS